MEALAWGGVLHYGTQNASRAGMFAARVNLTELNRDGGAAFGRLWEIGEYLAKSLNSVFMETGTAAIAQGVGPMLQVLFTDRPAITDFRGFCAHVDRRQYQRFALALFEHGIYMTPSSALHSVVSLAHTEEDVTATVEAAREVLQSGTDA
jgi:glutamate-1-semialdehyde 2,1-aminomutase